MAKELFVRYYQDHDMFFDKLQNLVLHLHLHFDELFDHHGSLCHLGTFSQEDFIGSISKNHHGTRFHGELITYYYEVNPLSMTQLVLHISFRTLSDRFCSAKYAIDQRLFSVSRCGRTMRSSRTDVQFGRRHGSAPYIYLWLQ